MSGMVTLVGAGPGDPGLLTRKGLEALEKAGEEIDGEQSPVSGLFPSVAPRIMFSAWTEGHGEKIQRFVESFGGSDSEIGSIGGFQNRKKKG